MWALGQFGILLADKESGPFRFEVQHITAVRDLDLNDYHPMLANTTRLKTLGGPKEGSEDQ